MRRVLGVDLGGTKTAVGVVDETGSVIARLESPTPAADGARAVLGTVIELARAAIGTERDVSAIGLGAAGVIDSQSGVVLSATDALPGWAGTQLVAEVANALSLPVVAMNDVHAHALGEAWTGSARGAQSMLMVTAGTGIGGAMLINGVVWPGAHSAAGHLGHLPSPEASGLDCACGRVGHLEAVASGPAIHSAFTRQGGTAADARAVAALAANEDPTAIRVLERAATALGRAIGGLVNTFDPEIVIVGGGLASSGPLWWDALKSSVAREVLPALSGCAILPAALGGDAAIVGAARAAIRLTEGQR